MTVQWELVFRVETLEWRLLIGVKFNNEFVMKLQEGAWDLFSVNAPARDLPCSVTLLAVRHCVKVFPPNRISSGRLLDQAGTR